MMNRKNTYCIYCEEKIGENTLICPHCNSYFPRTSWTKIVTLLIGLAIKFIIPILIISITIYQCNSAKKEKTKATEARQLADSAIIEVNNHIAEIKRFQSEQMKIDEECFFKFFIAEENWDYLPLSSALILNGSDYGNIYSNLVFINNAARRKHPVNNNNLQKYYFDLFEIAFFNWYLNEFSYKWSDVKIDNPALIKSNIIKKQITNNSLLETLNSKIDTWFLPPDSEIRIIQDNPIDTLPFQIPIEVHSTKIVIENRNFIFSIKFSNSLGFGKLERHDLKEAKVFSYFKTNNIWVENIKIEFTANFTAEYCLDEITLKEYAWINMLIEKFKNDYDWKLVKSDL